LRRASLWLLLVVGVVFAPTILDGTSFLSPLVFAGIFAVAVVGLSVLQGQAGIVSLGQGGFVAVGAYTAGILTVDHNWSTLAGLVGAIVVTTVLGVATIPVLRAGGLALSLVTFALAAITTQLIIVFDGFTGGQRGLASIPPLTIGGWEARAETRFFVVAWLIVVATAALAVNVLRSPYGSALRAQRADGDAAAALGIDVMRVRAAAWLFSAACAGCSGALLAYHTKYLSPEVFALGLSISLLAAIVIGGADSVFGPLVAIVLLRILPEVTDFGGHAGPLIWSGAMLLVIPAVWPGGLAELNRIIRSRVRLNARAQ
jgi:ABC-type branched-subunit amino acid transport system permease subunit